MKNIILFPALALLLLASCSPRVITNFVKTYPDPVPTDSVLVIEPGGKIPNSAEMIGSIAVIDRGTSTNCKYDQVVRIAKETTGKSGGNGLVITLHQKPSFWGSSCDQIIGLMLYLKDLETDSLKPNPVQEMIDSKLKTIQENRKKRRAPANTIEVSLGPGWITSEILGANDKKIDLKSGLEWKLSYEHIWNKGLGIGLQYSSYKVSFPEGDIKLSYIAPEFTGRIKADKWILKYGVGIGLALYSDPYYKTEGVGVSLSFGAEYMVSKNIGLGITTNYITSSLPSQNKANKKEDERSGINRINLLGGLRFYF